MIPHFTSERAVQQLRSVSGEFVELFTHGSLLIEYYQPDTIDRQQPHDRDEVYVIIAGTGQFLCAGECCSFSPGDLLFVPAGVEHRFEEFTADFATWVLFFGPVGGEQAKKQSVYL